MKEGVFSITLDLHMFTDSLFHLSVKRSRTERNTCTSESTSSTLAGPSKIEEMVFRQQLLSRREVLLHMRKPENYGKKGIKR